MEQAVFKAGTRPSRLALAQARDALDRIEALLPGIAFGLVPIASAGDADRTTDLRDSPPDFFTRELDEALLRGGIDLAVHSAKDLPDPAPAGIDWFWLPWREDPRDVLVLAKGRSVADLPPAPVAGVSSERREAWCRTRFPAAVQKTIRGNIEERIAQVDRGDYDFVVMAAAALVRLGLEDRIAEWIPPGELEPPEGQGCLAVTFRAGDGRMQALRSLFVPAVVFAGAGAGSREYCTLAALHALRRCDLCLHDSLIDPALLGELPPQAKALDVGKRCGAHGRRQPETTRLLCEWARRGRRIVRLKGGDPGIFGRLAEETEALEQLGIAFRAIPGIGALQVATTCTGMLLTRRDVSRGFVALTPRSRGGGLVRCDAAMKDRLPVVCYMATKAIGSVARQMLEDGHAPETPAAVVCNAGAADERIVKATLGGLPALAASLGALHPGLVIVGDIAAHGFKEGLGALRGARVLLTCSESIRQKAADRVRDFGGRPVPFPLVRLDGRRGFQPHCAEYDWLVATSPSAVHVFMERVAESKTDYRSIPRIMVCGPGTAAAFAGYGLVAEAQPQEDFGAASLAGLAARLLRPGERVLRIRSGKAGPDLAEALRRTGAEVEDAAIYDNVRVGHPALPAFDDAFFASASAVESFAGQWGVGRLEGKTVAAIGRPTARALDRAGRPPCVVAREATVESAIESLAAHRVLRRLVVA